MASSHCMSEIVPAATCCVAHRSAGVSTSSVQQRQACVVTRLQACTSNATLGALAAPENGQESFNATEVESIHAGGAVLPALGLDASAALHDMQPKAADIPGAAGTDHNRALHDLEEGARKDTKQF